MPKIVNIQYVTTNGVLNKKIAIVHYLVLCLWNSLQKFRAYFKGKPYFCGLLKKLRC
jgi:hypothetical protein